MAHSDSEFNTLEETNDLIFFRNFQSQFLSIKSRMRVKKQYRNIKIIDSIFLPNLPTQFSILSLRKKPESLLRICLKDSDFSFANRSIILRFTIYSTYYLEHILRFIPTTKFPLTPYMENPHLKNIFCIYNIIILSRDRWAIIK